MDPDYSRLTIPQLKSILRVKGLALAGNKAVLVARLNDSTLSSSHSSTSAVAPVERTSASQKSSEKSVVKPKKAKVSKEKVLVKSTESLVAPTSNDSSFPAISRHQDHNEIKVARRAIASSPPKTKENATELGSAISTLVTTSSTLPSGIKRVPAGNDGGDRSVKKSKVVLAKFTKDKADIAPAPSPTRSLLAIITDASPHQVHKTAAAQRQPITKFKPPLRSVSRQINIPKPSSAPVYQNRAVDPSFNKVAYIQSTFLHRFYDRLISFADSIFGSTLYPISQSFFDSSTAAQFLLTLRFIASRIYLALSHDFSPLSIFELPKIINAQRVIEGIWKLTMEDGEELTVLEITGEIIGTNEILNEEGTHSMGKGNKKREFRLRGDWEGFIRTVQERRDLLSLVVTSDEAYKNGLSKRLNMMMEKDHPTDVEQEMITVCKRFIFSHCSPHSISGSYESTSTSSHLYSSLPIPIVSNAFVPKKLGFYLPPPLCVESIHFDALMIAELAIVQTVGQGGLIVLRLTGQGIGHEVEGVGRLWQEILECDERGRYISVQ